MRVITFCAAMLLAMPAAAANVYDFAATTPQLSIFAQKMRQTGIDRALANPGPYTIFAPTDAAAAKLSPSLDRETLVQILTCHMAPTEVVSRALASGQSAVIRTVGGCRLTLTRTPSGLTLKDDAGRSHRIEAADLDQANGVVHIVDSLILPR
ncbi:fasciclin domain-containing protein [Falsirhodobacter algicola]|uniref:FAS1 domain-containing protein n=1 Tax=Falsirhodobacter algicola TaxID=2692330 RepID=A0A8J8SKE3_9RHOB|nr:fasciclin domain-containing protein [Falsirhodobacter algicola]QUS35426.1 hypothetical protein GR316_03560 [Falsirhodobacter algicola]